MSFRPTLLSSIIRPWPTSSMTFSRPLRSYHVYRRPAFRVRDIAIARPIPSPSWKASPLGLGIAASLAIFAFIPSQQVQCQSFVSQATSPRLTNNASHVLDEERSTSIVNAYELSFGAICGICAGVFVKKGAKAIAFLLGGAFVFLQYLASKSYINVDWTKIGTRYDSAFGTKTATGGYKGPTVGRVWTGLVDFLTSNFQQRASFLAGLALGIRLG
ncbi:uncharacterized protein L203_101774 [Cryptococcus depauperatus CBS 7841]|uniref:Uncharacterized protein n=1 Tax=Cryptococcus depauperatus CBS 7841 TaxID=1295531 RepID=A0A1E3IGT5_9TREE|nr:hypothetical protein L203_03010 [Cryptococcus depauperatus CBS 7841]